MSTPQKTGILMVNLGSPDEPTPTAVRRFLKQFLSDPRVVKVNRLLWWFVLNVIILNIRPTRVAKAYKQVWTEQGSPLITISQKQVAAVSERLNHLYGDQVVTECAMTYGNPSLEYAIDKLQKAGADQLIVFPLYPQFSYTTTAAVNDGVDKTLHKLNYSPKRTNIHDYHNHPAYIQALANSIERHWATTEKSQLLLFSLHGIPQRYVNQGDPYYDQCCETTRLVAEKLKLSKEDWHLVFQSRFGREPWLQPYCDKTLQALPDQGIHSVDILCPGFSADCLETLEEIQEENKDYFIGAGGKTFNYIPCLNDSDDHIDALMTIIQEHLPDQISGAD